MDPTIHQQLIDLNGKTVTVENRANQDTNCSALMIQVHGTLEDYTETFGEPHFLCRVKECHDGTSAVSFPPQHVLEIENTHSGRVVIVIR